MIKGVFIDIDDTILDFNQCARLAMKQVLEENGVEFREEMFPVFVRLNNGFWKDIEKGLLTKEGLYKIRWNTIFKELGIDLDGEAFEKRFVKTLQACAVPMDDAHKVLEYLSGKYILCAASNAPHNQQILRLGKADMLGYFKEVFTSGRLGYAKPSKEFFDGCFAALPDLKPCEVIMIGDSLTADISGGADYGFKTCWLNSRGDEMPLGVKPDYVITSLKDLEGII